MKYPTILAAASALLLGGCGQQSFEAPKTATPAILASGLQVYTANCATCHQVDGSGVSNMQPALLKDDVVNGDVDQLIRVVLKGPAAVLPAGRPRYSNVMPGFSRLNDQQIADLLTYVRTTFGPQATLVQASQVAAQRSALGL
jgi:mono/diheme cytochrome c family protein